MELGTGTSSNSTSSSSTTSVSHVVANTFSSNLAVARTETDLLTQNIQLQSDLRTARKELAATKVVAEALRSQVSQLINALQHANRKIAEQRDVIADSLLTKPNDIRDKLRIEYEQREQDLTARHVAERDAACQLLRQEIERRIADYESLQKESHRKIKQLQDQVSLADPYSTGPSPNALFLAPEGGLDAALAKAREEGRKNAEEQFAQTISAMTTEANRKEAQMRKDYEERIRAMERTMADREQTMTQVLAQRRSQEMESSTQYDLLRKVLEDKHQCFLKEARGHDALLRDAHAAEIQSLKAVFENEKRTLAQQYETKEAALRAANAAATRDLETRMNSIEKELQAVNQHGMQQKAATIAQVGDMVAATRAMEEQHRRHVAQLEEEFMRRLREMQVRMEQVGAQRDREVAESVAAAVLRNSGVRRSLSGTNDSDLTEGMESGVSQRRIQQLQAEWDRKMNEILSHREMEHALAIQKLTEAHAATIERLRSDPNGARDHLLLQKLQTENAELRRKLEGADRELRQSDVQYAEMEKQLRETLQRLPENSKQLTDKIQSLASHVQQSEANAQQLAKANKMLDNECIVLKERLRVFENDMETQRMFPLIGIEIAEGVTLGEDFKGQGVQILSVREPALAAGLQPQDLIKHAEVHHTAVVRDLYDFKQAVEKLRPGDLITCTVLRAGKLISKVIEVQASFANPYRRKTMKRTELRAASRSPPPSGRGRAH